MKVVERLGLVLGGMFGLIKCVYALRSFEGDVVVSHAWGGGAEKYLETLLGEARHNVLVVRGSKKRVYVEVIRGRDRGDEIVLSSGVFSLWVFFRILSWVKIECLYLNHLGSFKAGSVVMSGVALLRQRAAKRVVFFVHDYYGICPSTFLLNQSGEFCGIPEMARCEACARRQKFKFVFGGSMWEWRRQWSRLLNMCDSIICFSNSSRLLLLQTYGVALMDKVIVRPHEISGFVGSSRSRQNMHRPVRVGVLGNLYRHKGLDFVNELVRYADEYGCDYEFVVIGEVGGGVNQKVRVFGKYNNSDALLISRVLGVDFFLLPSVCPETFSYSAEEVMAMGYPLVVLDVGAPPERVAHYEYGKVIPYEVMRKPSQFYREVGEWFVGEVKEQSRRLNGGVRPEDVLSFMDAYVFKGGTL